MQAKDVMTARVISVGPDAAVREAAALLAENSISALPVIDATGVAVGMLSEGDLIGRSVKDRDERRDWWLEMLAEGETLAEEFLKQIRLESRSVKDLMATPVITVGEDTPVEEIAGLLDQFRIKRVPVVRDGRVIGIVSRADLVRALARLPRSAKDHHHSAMESAVAAIDSIFHRASSHDEAPTALLDLVSPASADGFRQLVDGFEHGREDRKARAHDVAGEVRGHEVTQMLDRHVSEAPWRGLLLGARAAAERGEKEFLLLQFPSELCDDGGRKINVMESDWCGSLRGEAADIYLRWEHELKPQGFGLLARVLDFPGGFPGDIGLFVTWH